MTTTTQPTAHPAMFAALAVPNFRRYVSGQSLSLIGAWVETVAQGLLVLRLTHSGTVLGLTTAARYAPILLLATQIGLGLVSAVLGAAVLTGDIRLWQVVALGVLFGIFSALDNPARQAFTQEVVGHDLVRNAVTLNTTTVNVARVIGPTIAAVLVSTVGIGWCFVVNAVSFGFVVVSLLSLDTRRLHPVPLVPRGRGQLRAGLRYAAGVPAIIRPLLMMALVGTFTFEFEVSLPLLAETTFHGTGLSQVVLSFGIPFALVPLVILTSRRDVMGSHVNQRRTTIAGGISVAVIIALNVLLLRQQFCPS